MFAGSAKKREIFLLIAFFSFGLLNAVSAGQNEYLDQQEKEKPAVNSQEKTDVVPVTSTDVAISGQGNSQSQNTVSDSDVVKALAVGYVKAGKNKSEIISTLGEMGYSKVDSEIAYTKAVDEVSAGANSGIYNAAEEAAASSEAGATEATSQVTAEISEPEKPAQERLKEGIGPTKPIQKFRQPNNYAKETGVVSEMVGEGYSADSIAEGLHEMGYSTEQIATILNKSEVSADQAYGAISKIALAEVDAESGAKRPTAKFKSGNGGKWQEAWEKQQAAELNDIKQETIKGIVAEMEQAGFNVRDSLDGVVADLKASGMSAAQIGDYLVAKVADGKPRNKFKGALLSRVASNWQDSDGNSRGFYLSKDPVYSNYGNGEVLLAAAMLKSGFSEEEVDSAFADQKGNYYGSHSYTYGARVGIISAAQNLLKNSA